jgi:hypothetical protein
VDKRREENGRSRRDTEPKTRTPHKDVGKKPEVELLEAVYD